VGHRPRARRSRSDGDIGVGRACPITVGDVTRSPLWDHVGDGEPAGWSRPASSRGSASGREQVEEGRDSTGQGAG